MDADVSFDERHKGGRQRRVGLAPSWQVLRLRFDEAQATETQKPVSPGRARDKPLTPSRREGRSFGSNLWWTYSYASSSRIRGYGCGQRTRLSLRPLKFFEGSLQSASLKRNRAVRMRNHALALFDILNLKRGRPRVNASTRGLLLAHDLRANATRSSREKPVRTFPDQAPPAQKRRKTSYAR
jgi:hypothetical protein